MLEFPRLGFSEILGEVRIFGEYLRFRSDSAIDSAVKDQRTTNPDWRPVLLIPGFMAGDASLYPLGARLRSLGHRVFYAGIWMNADCPAKTLERLRKRIHEISLQTGRKVAVIGHSLGGIYARELARMEPDLVERVFLLGSPVKHALGNTSPYLRPLVAAMRFMHGQCMEDLAAECKSCGFDLPQNAPDVPETCIYTRSDGIVEWHSCIDDGPQVECVEVDSSHCGIPLNLKTWQEISSRLSGAVQEAHPKSSARPVRRMQAVAPRTPHRTRPSHLTLVARKGHAA
jgi:triacylglycerol lipase